MTYTVLPSGLIRRDADGATIPADNQNADYLIYLEWSAENTAPVEAAPPPPPPELSKVILYTRMTDVELAALDGWLENSATVRQRRLWDDATAIGVTEPEVVMVATALFGAERAAVILAV